LNRLLNVVDAGLLGPRLVVEPLSNIQLRCVEVEDLAKKNSRFYFHEYILRSKKIIPDVQGV